MKTFKYVTAGLLLVGCLSMKAWKEDGKSFGKIRIANGTDKQINIEVGLKDKAEQEDRGIRKAFSLDSGSSNLTYFSKADQISTKNLFLTIKYNTAPKGKKESKKFIECASFELGQILAVSADGVMVHSFSQTDLDHNVPVVSPLFDTWPSKYCKSIDYSDL